MNYKVTVIGAGRMGSGLATALFHQGFATTVWNRTGAKTEALARLGLSVAPSVEESVREADIVVVSVSDYNSTRRLLRQPDIETALRGKIVVQLSSGTPKEAREMDSWARQFGISYLDGAILGSPGWIGTPACTIFYSGPEEVFNRAKPVLMTFGDRTVFVGHEIGHASAFDVAILTFGVSAMFGFLQGQVVWKSENLPAGGFLETIKGMMPAMESIFTDMSRRISSRTYSGDDAALEAYSVVTKQLVSWCQDRGSDHTIPDAYVNLMERAIHAGKSQADFACLFEILSDVPVNDFAKRYTTAWCSQNAASVAAHFAERGSLTINGAEPAIGRAAITAAAQGFMTAFPDMVVKMDRLEVDGSHIEYHWTLTGTNTGPCGTGRPVRISGVEKWRIAADGLIEESKGRFDEADYQRQLSGAEAHVDS